MDVWAWRQEARRCARAERFLNLHSSNSKSYKSISDFFSEDAPLIFGQHGCQLYTIVSAQAPTMLKLAPTIVFGHPQRLRVTRHPERF